MTNDDNATDEQVDAREAARVQSDSEQGTDEPGQHDQEEAEARGLQVEGDDR